MLLVPLAMTVFERGVAMGTPARGGLTINFTLVIYIFLFNYPGSVTLLVKVFEHDFVQENKKKKKLFTTNE